MRSGTLADGALSSVRAPLGERTRRPVSRVRTSGGKPQRSDASLQPAAGSDSVDARGWLDGRDAVLAT